MYILQLIHRETRVKIGILGMIPILRCLRYVSDMYLIHNSLCYIAVLIQMVQTKELHSMMFQSLFTICMNKKDNPLFLGGDVDVPRGNDHDND